MKQVQYFIFTLLVISMSNVFAANTSQPMESAYRLPLSAKSTIENPTYFACFVTNSKTQPPLEKWTPGLKFLNVYLTNYAHNTLGFNGNGILQTTSGYLNTHYFKTYHDEDFPKSVAGHVDAFVLWAGYHIECRDLTAAIKFPEDVKNRQHNGYIDYRYNRKEYHLSLAGSDYT